MGVHPLFETSNIFKNTRNNITIRRGLGNSGVYRIGKKKALNFDRIIIIFDLDALSTKNIKDNASLSTESFIEILKENALNIIETYNDIVKRPYKRKDTNNDTKEINKTQSRLSACKTNIDIMLGNGIRSIKTIRSNLKTMGFEEDIINEAIDSLSVM